MTGTDDLEERELHELQAAQLSVLDEMRSRLRSRLGEGTTCPVCDQHAQMYRRKLNAGMAQALGVMYERGGLGWFHKPTVLRGVGASARDESLLRFWGLIEERRGRSPDGRAGWWRVTRKGERFLLGEVTVPKYVLVYNGKFLRFDGEETTFEEAAGQRFSLRELLEAG